MMTYWLEQLTGKITMYRLALYVLCGLFGFGLFLSTVGQLNFTPLAMVLSVSVLTAVAWGSNRVFGWLYGVKPQGESALISALILFFIFSPTTEISQLVVLALVAVFSQASKYVLAVRKRHVFNPSAVAAVIIGLIGITYASWWVATPALLPVTILGSLLILYKTRRITMGVLFVAVAYVLAVLYGVGQGETLHYMLGAALTSWPLFFFAGFMLSEPLTLPPRKWQQLSLAVLVALIFTTPLHVGSVTMAPEIALVIGNIIAFLAAPRRGLTLTVSSVTNVTPSTKSFVFKAPGAMHFVPGQYIELSLPHNHADGRGVRRMFSIVSTSGADHVEVAVKIPEPSSTFKRVLAKLQSGDTVRATTVSGDFTLPRNKKQKVLLVAGGIGVTPYISQLRSLTQNQEQRDVILIYAVATTDEIAYTDVLRQSGAQIIVVSSGIKQRIPGWQYIELPQLDIGVIREHVPDVRERIVYVSGPPGMVNGLKQIFKQAHAKRIKTDFFSGY
jgi:ferredoxin-NADP reductase